MTYNPADLQPLEDSAYFADTAGPQIKVSDWMASQVDAEGKTNVYHQNPPQDDSNIEVSTSASVEPLSFHLEPSLSPLTQCPLSRTKSTDGDFTLDPTYES